MKGTSGPQTVSTKQQRIAKLAKEEKRALSTLAHHIDVDWMKEAFRRTRKDGAPGIDGQTAEQYELQLEANLRSLLSRAKSGEYRAPAVRRVHIPKGDGSQTRPIGIPTFEDKVLQRAVQMVLEGNAGVHEAGTVSRPEAGTPQGGVISPLLANIYLHEVLDVWFDADVKPRLRGQAFLVRYADDFVIGFSNEEDARRVMDVLPKRFGKYGLTLHPEKTRLLQFERPREGQGGPPPESFDFLGFNHHWEKSRNGWWVVKRKTAKSRFTRALTKVAEWCRMNRHEPMKKQHQHLSAALRGHYGYFGITGNSRALSSFQHEVKIVWRKWLARRSQRGLSWAHFTQLLKRFALPPPRAIHSKLRSAKP